MKKKMYSEELGNYFRFLWCEKISEYILMGLPVTGLVIVFSEGIIDSELYFFFNSLKL